MCMVFCCKLFHNMSWTLSKDFRWPVFTIVEMPHISPLSAYFVPKTGSRLARWLDKYSELLENTKLIPIDIFLFQWKRLLVLWIFEYGVILSLKIIIFRIDSQRNQAYIIKHKRQEWEIKRDANHRNPENTVQ